MYKKSEIFTTFCAHPFAVKTAQNRQINGNAIVHVASIIVLLAVRTFLLLLDKKNWNKIVKVYKKNLLQPMLIDIVLENFV